LDLLTRIRTDLDKRLDELRPQIEEIPRLQATLKALDEADGRAPARRKPASRTSTTTAPAPLKKEARTARAEPRGDPARDLGATRGERGRGR